MLPLWTVTSFVSLILFYLCFIIFYSSPGFNRFSLFLSFSTTNFTNNTVWFFNPFWHPNIGKYRIYVKLPDKLWSYQVFLVLLKHDLEFCNIHLDLLCFFVLPTIHYCLVNGLQGLMYSETFRGQNNLLLYFCLPKIRMMIHTATMAFALTLL